MSGTGTLKSPRAWSVAVSGTLLIVGGALSGYGSVSTWGELHGPGGVVVIQGRSAGLVVGGALAGVGLVLMLARERRLRVLLAASGLILAVVQGVFATSAMSDGAWASAGADALAKSSGMHLYDVQRDAWIDQFLYLMERGQMWKEPGIAFYGFPVGALVAVVGAFATLAAASKRAHTQGPAAGTGHTAAPLGQERASPPRGPGD